jgi:hypothetical protein
LGTYFTLALPCRQAQGGVTRAIPESNFQGKFDFSSATLRHGLFAQWFHHFLALNFGPSFSTLNYVLFCFTQFFVIALHQSRHTWCCFGQGVSAVILCISQGVPGVLLLPGVLLCFDQDVPGAASVKARLLLDVPGAASVKTCLVLLRSRRAWCCFGQDVPGAASGKSSLMSLWLLSALVKCRNYVVFVEIS